MPPNEDDLVDNSLLDGEDNDGFTGDDNTRADPPPKKNEEDDDAGANNDFADLEVVVDDSEPEQKGDDDAGDQASGAADDGAQTPDDDLKEHSAKVRERIERERAARRAADERARAAHQRAVKAELESIAAQKDAFETTEAALQIQINAVKRELVKAKDDGKTTEEVDLQEKLNKLTRSQENLERSKAMLKEREEAAKRGGQQDNQPNPLAADWQRANSQWFGNARFAEQSQIVRVIDRAMFADGWDPSKPEYYEELNRRIRRRLPEVQKFMPAPTRRAAADPKQQRRDPTGGVRRGNGGAPTVQRMEGGKQRVVLTRAHLENMRQFGLDPANREHQLEYARNTTQPVKGAR